MQNYDHNSPSNGALNGQSVLDQVDQYLSDHNVTRGSERPVLDLDFDVVAHRSHDMGEQPKLNMNDHHHQHHQHPGSHHMPFHFDLDVSALPPSHDSRLVRPDMVFSPMVSPVVEPATHHSTSASHTNTPFLRSQATNSSHSAIPSSKPHFSPLSSPAMDALENLAALKRVSSSSSSRGKRTPMSTPALTATTAVTSAAQSSSSSSASVNTNSKVVKNSPQLAHRRSANSVYTKRKSTVSSNWDDMFKLPDSSIPPPPLTPATVAGNPPIGLAGQHHYEDSKSSRPASSMSSTRTHNSANSTVTLGNSDLELDGYHPHQLYHNDATPATVMKYPKVILPSTASVTTQSPVRDSVQATGGSGNDNNGGHQDFIVASESPVIKATNPSPFFQRSSTNRKISAGAVSVRTTPELKAHHKNSKSLCDIDGDGDDASATADNTESGQGEEYGDKNKKDVHKAAEQGRRNRLNNALAELHGLIPLELRESILIPSKATTVELACDYIRDLLARASHPPKDI
ncbi:LANO_0F10374g1_1 [Lachancea nothofagi CBS 11611]|uniref:LANO_0F10374g1_1 n=1 Tax=Lachancea nothofagi CBS 11611 TaxID=1266666 RepID=A0A1G4KAB3_9SACH|nr:LANO_0F10374g1_1 [Lachancea nothofagi CBS 11611]